MEFDEYIGIDWSGAKSPQRSFSISLACCKADIKSAPTPILEKLSRTQVFEYIKNKASGDHKTLIGIDCNFSYAEKVVRKQLGDHANYQKLWQVIDELNTEHANFFAGNVWTKSAFAGDFWISGKQPTWFDAEKLRRLTESASIKQNLGMPESPFKMIGAKQVGKGGLAGMRLLYSLKSMFGDAVAIWPFELEKIDCAKVVICEIYPRLFIRHAGFGNNKVRNIKDLNSILEHFNCEALEIQQSLNDHLSDAIIASAGLKWYCENGNPLEIQLPQDSQNIEGWIFGVATDS